MKHTPAGYCSAFLEASLLKHGSLQSIITSSNVHFPLCTRESCSSAASVRRHVVWNHMSAVMHRQNSPVRSAVLLHAGSLDMSTFLEDVCA